MSHPAGARGSRATRARSALALWAILLAATPAEAPALEAGRPVFIGVLTESWGPPPGAVGLVEGLSTLGYREYVDFVVGVRFTQGDATALPAAARELLDAGTDVFLAVGEAAALAARGATATHPIVFTAVGDPVGLGLVASFARPGGNVTGVADLDRELVAKKLQLFQALVPGLERVLFPFDAGNEYFAVKLTHLERAARRLGIVLLERRLETQEDARELLANVDEAQVDGIMAPGAVELNIPGFVIEATQRQGIPSMFDSTFYVEIGGLASYGSSFHASGLQAARLVHKILEGTAPGDIPVEVDQRFEFAINLKVAQTLGITIPPEVLYQADRVIQ